MTYSITTTTSWAQTQNELADTFEKWGITEWQTNYPRGARLTGLNQSEVDRTVRLSFTKAGKQVNLEMGSQRRAVDNLRVLYLAVEAMRLNEKRGVSEVLQSAYMQLEAPQPDPYGVLGIMRDVPLEVAEAAYRARAKAAHPDAGGSKEEFSRLTKAIEAIRAEKGAE